MAGGRILIFAEHDAGAQAASLAADLRAAPEAHGLEVELLEGAGAVAAALDVDRTRHAVMVAVFVGADGSSLRQARRLSQHASSMRFMFLVAPDRDAAFRREASYAAPPGGRWRMVPEGEPSAHLQVLAEVDMARRQSRFRTTLDRMRVRLPPAMLPDAGEYRRLVASDRYLASVLRHAHDAIVSVDLAGRVVSWNKGAEHLFGLSMEQAQRQPFQSLFRDREAAAAALDAAMTGSFRMAGLEVEHDGPLRHVDGNFGALHDDAHVVIGAVAILRDITERYRAEQELRSASRQKDDFLAMLAHELRNPIAPIRNATRILAMVEHGDERVRHASEVIARQTEHLTGLVDDLLDVARVTRGAIELQREPVSIAAVVADAVEQATELIARRDHLLHVVQEEETLRVVGDRKRLTQVLTNLLVNAAKYTPPSGRIDLRTQADGDHVVISVCDTGVGIRAEDLAQVFDPFMQAERSPDRAQGGLGIGLALVRSLVAMHGGSVSASSDGTGKGSRFEVRLPRAEGQVDARHPDATPTPGCDQRLRIMVVDDNEDSAHTLGILLKSSGYRTDVLLDPRAALERAQRELPDVFILDIGMPHMDGYELARRIRDMQAPQRPLLVALTGYGHEADRQRAFDAGFDHHLVKPLDPDALSEILADAVPAGG